MGDHVSDPCAEGGFAAARISRKIQGSLAQPVEDRLARLLPECAVERIGLFGAGRDGRHIHLRQNVGDALLEIQAQQLDSGDMLFEPLQLGTRHPLGRRCFRFDGKMGFVRGPDLPRDERLQVPFQAFGKIAGDRVRAVVREVALLLILDGGKCILD